jgi:hypothetical protein
MCLTLTVRAPAAAADALAAAVAALPTSAVAVEPPRRSHAPLWPWARARPPEAFAPCLCALLSDEADWHAAEWALRPEAREPLAETLERLARAVPGAEVEVLWIGDRAEREAAVTPAGLAALARASALGTKTRYLILDAPAS